MLPHFGRDASHGGETSANLVCTEKSPAYFTAATPYQSDGHLRSSSRLAIAIRSRGVEACSVDLRIAT